MALKRSNDMFKFHIVVKSTLIKGNFQRIASFQREIDRDDCAEFLQEKYPDITFCKNNEE
jgi:hypothetical protein